MQRISIQRGWRRPAGGFRAGVIALCALTALLFPVDSIHAQRAGADKPAIRVIGPLTAKEMVDALAADFAKGASSPAVDYSRIENSSAAGRALLGGRDMMLCLGAVADKDLGYAADRWKALSPREHTIAAQAVAIVVHPRNAIESMTLKQLQAAFSGEARDWTVFGGRRTAIRRYGLAFTDPLSRLFHEKVLSAGKCRMLMRKADSAEAIKALVGDPDGVAFVDAVAAMSAGDTVKIVAIGADAVSPNAQTIEDGSYPLSATLRLYVSPEASEAAKDFAQFILAGKGDVILREHGFMPTLRAASANVLAAFEKLYGPDIKRVKGTPDTTDDLALAAQMIQPARTGKLDAELLAAMCEAAFDLAASASGGETRAFEALDVLAEKVPDKRFDCALKRAALCERVYKESKSRADGEHLTQALMTAGELGTSSHRFADAADAWKKALAVAEGINSPKLATIKEQLPAFEARVESLRKAGKLADALRANPQDRSVRDKMLVIQLVELDNPAEAAKYLDATADEAMKTNLPLATEPVDELSEDAALKLAEWYVGLAGKAGVGGKELMNVRARACYLRFFELHKGREDALAMRAALGIQKVGGKVPEPRAESKPDHRRRPRHVTAGLNDGEEITDLKLAEFIAAHPNLTRLTRREIGTARRITDLRPLERLTKLATLELHQAGNVEDLSPLAKLPSLTNLTITGLETEDISALSGLSKLTALNISGAGKVTDLAPIGRLLRLKTLNLSGCVKIKELKPLSRLTGLTSLNISGCGAVNDIGPLEKLARSLTLLNLNGTKVGYITPLARMSRLKTLDLRRCEQISADDAAWLTKRLSDCKVLSDAPQDKPASTNSGAGGW